MGSDEMLPLGSASLVRILDLRIKLKKVEARREIDSETVFLGWFCLVLYYGFEEENI